VSDSPVLAAINEVRLAIGAGFAAGAGIGAATLCDPSRNVSR
jgi:hypothetical protein